MKWTDEFSSVLRDVATLAPIKDRRVEVTEGKRQGVTGIVLWNGPDRFNRTAYRYCDGYQAHLRDVRRAYGYRVRIQPDDGGEPFFYDAALVKVLA